MFVYVCLCLFMSVYVYLCLFMFVYVTEGDTREGDAADSGNEMVDVGEKYIVEKIIQCKRDKHKKLFYQIQWVGYTELSWEHRDAVDSRLRSDFHKPARDKAERKLARKVAARRNRNQAGGKKETAQPPKEDQKQDQE
jgi:hypothetical protein